MLHYLKKVRTPAILSHYNLFLYPRSTNILLVDQSESLQLPDLSPTTARKFAAKPDPDFHGLDGESSVKPGL